MSAERLAANFRAVQAAAPRSEILAVIKADAYGHGAEGCALALAAAGARWFGVTDLEEGVRVRQTLRESGWAAADKHVVVMSGFEREDAAAIVRAGLTPVVWAAEHVAALQRAATEAGEHVPVHLEIDTGMARQGAPAGVELAAVLDALRASGRVRCEGVFSHLSSSEIVGAAETARQRVLLDEALEQIFEAELIPEWMHVGNSSAIDEGSTASWMRERAETVGAAALVRPGLALYGYSLPLVGLGSVLSDEFGRDAPKAQAGRRSGQLRGDLQPVATWKTRVIGVREIAAGDTVGYGATFVAEKPTRLALLPVGYADGFRREASSGVGDGWVRIAGRRAAVVGRVSMNLTVVDVTEFAPAIGVGDEVVLLGEGVTAEDHARWCGTIAYEILCGMRGHRRLV